MCITSTLILILCGCNTQVADEVPTETRTIVVEEVQEHKNIMSSRGIENSAVSLNNPLFIDIIKKTEKQQVEQESIVSPEEIQYGGTVCADGAYKCSEGEYEVEYVGIEPKLEQTEVNTENSNYVGSFDITAYTWTGNPMANGEYPYVGCAASCDFPLGTVLYIEGIGTYIIKDVCPTSGVVDIYMDSYDACINFGRQYANVYIIN